MERVFSVLGKPLCLAIFLRLLRDGPATLKELQADGIGGKSATADALTTLIKAGVVRRDAPREGQCHIVWPQLSADLLVAGGRLSVQVASAAAKQAESELAELEELAQTKQANDE